MKKLKEIIACLKQLAKCFGLAKKVEYRTISRTDENGDVCIFTVKK